MSESQPDTRLRPGPVAAGQAGDEEATPPRGSAACSATRGIVAGAATVRGPRRRSHVEVGERAPPLAVWRSSVTGMPSGSTLPSVPCLPKMLQRGQCACVVEVQEGPQAGPARPSASGTAPADHLYCSRPDQARETRCLLTHALRRSRDQISRTRPAG